MSHCTGSWPPRTSWITRRAEDKSKRKDRKWECATGTPGFYLSHSGLRVSLMTSDRWVFVPSYAQLCVYVRRHRSSLCFLTCVFWILKSTEALLAASSLGMLSSMAERNVKKKHKRLFQAIWKNCGWQLNSHFSLVRTTLAFPLMSSVSAASWSFVPSHTNRKCVRFGVCLGEKKLSRQSKYLISSDFRWSLGNNL